MRSLLLKNAPIKAIALVATILIFAFVRGDRPAETVVEVQLVYKLPLDRVLMSTPVERVRVSLRGTWSRVSRFDALKLDSPVAVDLTAAPSGEFRFDEGLFRVPPGIKVAAVEPPSMQLVFEARMTKTIAVEPHLLGQPAPGFVVERVTVSPDKVVLSGGTSAVSGLRKVATSPLSIEGAHESILRTVDLQPLPRAVELADPRSIRVEILVRPRANGR